MKKNNIFKFDLIILAILSRHDSYGYEISTIISNESNGIIVLKEGVIYPILYKLLNMNLIKSYEKRIEQRLRVYYQINEAGLLELNQQKKDFTESVQAIEKIIHGC